MPSSRQRVARAMSLLICGALTYACNVEPDIVARANDAGFGLGGEDDGGGIPDCETESRLILLSLQPNCELDLPPLPDDFDWRRFNVNVMQNDELVPYAGGLLSIDDCEQVEHGWYWIEHMNDARIGFCPQTCTLIEQWQRIAFQFGCDTLLPYGFPPPR